MRPIRMRPIRNQMDMHDSTHPSHPLIQSNPIHHYQLHKGEGDAITIARWKKWTIDRCNGNLTHHARILRTHSPSLTGFYIKSLLQSACQPHPFIPTWNNFKYYSNFHFYLISKYPYILTTLICFYFMCFHVAITKFIFFFNIHAPSF